MRRTVARAGQIDRIAIYFLSKTRRKRTRTNDLDRRFTSAARDALTDDIWGVPMGCSHMPPFNRRLVMSRM
jgi:hypothetical protein